MLNKRKVKTNSFSGNPSFQQIAAYMVYLTVTFSDILIGVHLFKNEERTILSIIYGIILLLALLSSSKCSLIDPTDQIIYLQRKMKKNNLYFNYVDHQLDFYCDNCNAFVSNNSKHCGYCNRCTSRFDHHCKWINNCIGGANYYWFMRMITFVLCQAIVSLTLNCVIIGRFNTNELSFNDNSIIVFQSNSQKIILVSFVMGLDCLIIFMLFQLLIFHIYLIQTNQTTYEFLMHNKSNSKVVVPDKEQQITEENRFPPNNLMMNVAADNRQDQEDTVNQDQVQEQPNSSDLRPQRIQQNQGSMEVVVQNSLLPVENENFIHKKPETRIIQSQRVQISQNNSMEEHQLHASQVTSQYFFSHHNETHNNTNQRVRNHRRLDKIELKKLDFD